MVAGSSDPIWGMLVKSKRTAVMSVRACMVTEHLHGVDNALHKSVAVQHGRSKQAQYASVRHHCLATPLHARHSSNQTSVVQQRHHKGGKA